MTFQRYCQTRNWAYSLLLLPFSCHDEDEAREKGKRSQTHQPFFQDVVLWIWKVWRSYSGNKAHQSLIPTHQICSVGSIALKVKSRLLVQEHDMGLGDSLWMQLERRGSIRMRQEEVCGISPEPIPCKRKNRKACWKTSRWVKTEVFLFLTQCLTELQLCHIFSGLREGAEVVKLPSAQVWSLFLCFGLRVI